MFKGISKLDEGRNSKEGLNWCFEHLENPEMSRITWLMVDLCKNFSFGAFAKSENQ